MAVARNPAIYVEVTCERKPQIVDGKLVQHTDKKLRRDTGKEKACENEQCMLAHAAAMANPGFKKNGKPNCNQECGDNCHMELS